MKLNTLLYEVVKDKRAVLFAGPAGSGKSTIVKTFVPTEYKEYIINPDKYFEPALQKIGGGSMKQNSFTSDQLSQSAVAMADSQKQAKADYREALVRGRPIIMDITGGSKNETAKRKHELERAGYDVMMVMVYASPMATLKRNSVRDRSLKPSIVLRNWKQVVDNIEYYQRTFGDRHFVMVNNDDKEGGEDVFSADKAEEYFKVNPNFKGITPEEKAIMDRDINALITRVNQHDFFAFDELDSRLKAFLDTK